MLTMVTAQNAQNGVLELPLMNSSGGYSVRGIEGLGPVKATLVSTAFAQRDGGQLHYARREPRNIVIHLGIEPDYLNTSVAGLRSQLYEFFMPKTQVSLAFFFDNVLTALTSGVVESCDPAIFSSDPDVYISVMCYDPDFYAPIPVQLDGYTVSDTTVTPVVYEGSSETGVLFSLTFPVPSSELRLYNTRPDNQINVFSISGEFQADDNLRIDSNPGHKLLTVTRAGLTTSGIYSMEPRSDWISFVRGTNLFRAYYDGDPISYKIEYTPKYGGF